MSDLRVAAAALLLTAFFASPLLVHSGRDVTVSGKLRTDSALSVVQQKNAVQTWAKYRFGVTPEGFRPGDPLPLVLETPLLTDAEIATLAAAGHWRCTRRDVLWEGLPHEDRAFFAERLQAKVTGDTLLCELGAPDARGGLQSFLLIFASAALTVAIASLAARRFFVK